MRYRTSRTCWATTKGWAVPLRGERVARAWLSIQPFCSDLAVLAFC